MEFILGTAQFGLDYGITNLAGKPSSKEIDKILDFSVKNGISYFDTAYSYGDASSCLASWVGKQKHSDHLRISHKFTLEMSNEEIQNNLMSFLRISGINSFDSFFLHSSLDNVEKNARRIEALERSLKGNGIVVNFGVSLYSPEELYLCGNLIPLDIIQCPINIFDQRFLSLKVTEFCQSHNIKIHSRSLFLQGVLLSKQLPKKLEDLHGSWNKYQKLLKKYNLSHLGLCLAWIKSSSFIEQCVVGVNCVSELREILDIYDECPDLNGMILDEIQGVSCNKNPLIDPRNWN